MKTPNIQKYNEIEAVSVGFETFLFRDLCFSFEVKKEGIEKFLQYFNYSATTCKYCFLLNGF